MSAKLEPTEKQQAFVDAYRGEANGNAPEAARMAGYASPETQGYNVLLTRAVAAALNNHGGTSTLNEDKPADLYSRVQSLDHRMNLNADGILALRDELTVLGQRIDELARLVGQP